MLRPTRAGRGGWSWRWCWCVRCRRFRQVGCSPSHRDGCLDVKSLFVVVRGRTRRRRRSGGPGPWSCRGRESADPGTGSSPDRVIGFYVCLVSEHVPQRGGRDPVAGAVPWGSVGAVRAFKPAWRRLMAKPHLGKIQRGLFAVPTEDAVTCTDVRVCRFCE